MKNLNSKKIKSFILLISMVFLCFIFFTGCENSEIETGKLKIVTTLFPQYDFTRQIVGDKANVTLLLQPGIEAHSFDPSPSDVVDINECDLFIYTGEYMETWANDILSSLESDVSVLNVSEGILMSAVEEEHEHEEDVHEYDPHIWTSPKNAIKMVENILDTLVEMDPENKDYYTENANLYLAELKQLDTNIREVVEKADIKTIFFGGKFAMYYFAQEYGLDYIAAFDSCTSETEPSAKLVARIVDAVKEQNAPEVYYEELSNHKAADTICTETGAKPLLLHSCHNISKDEYKLGVTYLSLMKQNLENLKEGLYLK